MRTARTLAIAIALVLLATSATAASSDSRGGKAYFYTTAGALTEGQVGDVLAHQHLFVEYGAAPPTKYVDATPQQVYQLVGPWMEQVKAMGTSVFVDPTPLGVGRRPDIEKYVGDRSGLPVMMVTGIYREPYMPDWVYSASVHDIAKFMRTELRHGVGDTGVPAGWIKVSQNDTGMTLTERKILQAACQVARETGAAIGSHITSGTVALSVMDALESFGCPASKVRFIWIHAMWTARMSGAALEGGRTGHDAGIDYVMAALKRGAYVDLDGIGSGFWGWGDSGVDKYDQNIAWIRQFADAGFADHVIIGSDTGWYDPGCENGVCWYAQDYSSVPGGFVPAMRAAGLSEKLIHKLMHDNPWDAYSRPAID